MQKNTIVLISSSENVKSTVMPFATKSKEKIPQICLRRPITRKEKKNNNMCNTLEDQLDR